MWVLGGKDEVSAGDVAGNTNSQDPAVTQVLENTPSHPEEQIIQSEVRSLNDCQT